MQMRIIVYIVWLKRSLRFIQIPMKSDAEITK